VLGWSMGSRIAMQLSVSHPELVDKMILCSPNPGKNEASRKTDAYAELTQTKFTKEKILSLIFPDTSEGKKASSEYILRLTQAVMEKAVPEDINISQEVIKRQKHALQLWTETDDVFNKLPDMKSPALITGGLSDVLDPPENVQIIADKIPFAWTAYFAGAGHAFLFQDAERFANLVILFIESSRN
jgi:pimeloyl-ACP methyl ester carboxylesterase